MTIKSEKASLAMQSYLDELFHEESEASQAKSTKAQTIEPDTRSTSTLKKQYSPGKQSSDLTTEQRHQIERVERLLDDYNQRAQIQQTTDESATLEYSIERNTNISLLRPVLEAVEQQPVKQSLKIAPESIEQSDTEPQQDIASKADMAESVLAVSRLSEFQGHAFQALIFNVAGMDLAVPLISLGGINRLDQEVTQLFGKPDWFMGLTPGIDGNINVVDSCRWVMPERYGEAKTNGLNYSFIMLLGESNWGLACSHVQNAITIEPENVKWRNNDTKRPWLAGMLIEQRCVLLDVDVMIELLNSDYQR